MQSGWRLHREAAFPVIPQVRDSVGERTAEWAGVTTHAARLSRVSSAVRVLAARSDISSGGWGGRSRGVERRSSIGFSRSALWPSLSSESGLCTCRYLVSSLLMLPVISLSQTCGLDRPFVVSS